MGVPEILAAGSAIAGGIGASQERAERRLGELLIEQKATVGLATGGRPAKETPAAPEGVYGDTPSLAEIGVSYKLSSHAQRVAAIPAAEFEGIVGQWWGKFA